MKNARLLGFAWFAASGFCVLTVLMMTDAAVGFDTEVRGWMHGYASPALTKAAFTLTWLGALGVLGVLGAIAAGLLLRAGRRRDALLLVFTMAGALVLENGLKFTLQRARPPPFFGVNPLTYGFPSGHALFSLCFYGMLAVILTRELRFHRLAVAIWGAGLVLVGVIGATRVYLGVHYPSDVVGGYLVAWGWICVALVLEKRFFPRR